MCKVSINHAYRSKVAPVGHFAYILSLQQRNASIELL